MSESLEINRKEMVEVEKCFYGLLKSLGFVETLREIKKNSWYARDAVFVNGVLKREGELVKNCGKAKASDRIFVIES